MAFFEQHVADEQVDSCRSWLDRTAAFTVGGEAVSAVTSGSRRLRLAGREWPEAVVGRANRLRARATERARAAFMNTLAGEAGSALAPPGLSATVPGIAARIEVHPPPLRNGERLKPDCHIGNRIMSVRFCLVLFAALLGQPQISCAWSPCIQGVISLSAVEGLSTDERVKLINLVRHHPQYKEMIAPPEGSDPNLWEEILIIRAGTWADRIAGTKYDRPNWHFYPGVAHVFGKLAATPAKPPTDLANVGPAEIRDLNLVQAIKFCYRASQDKALDVSERAIAICWLMNLVGDIHQPLHLGSLYAEPAFGEGKGDDHGRRLLWKGRTLFEVVENFAGCGDDVSDVLRAKREFEGGDSFPLFLRGQDSPFTEVGFDILHELNTVEASVTYRLIQKPVRIAMITQRFPPPLSLSFDTPEGPSLTIGQDNVAAAASDLRRVLSVSLEAN